MAVTVLCKHKKCQMKFNNLNEGDIKEFDCGDDCQPKMPKEEVQAQPEIPKMTEETPSQKKSRLKAEKKAKEEAEKQKVE